MLSAGNKPLRDWLEFEFDRDYSRPRLVEAVEAAFEQARRETTRARSSAPSRPPTRPRLRAKYVKRVVDRRGVARYYFGRRGRKPFIRLPGPQGTPGFEQAYEAARRVAAPRSAPPRRSRHRTISGLVDRYLCSDAYKRLAPETQRAYERVMLRLLFKYRLAHVGVAALSTRRIRHIVEHEHFPAAAADLLKKLRVLMRFGEAIGWRKDDPTRRVAVKHGGAPRRRWSKSEIAAFEARWPLGTRQRTAIALMLHTGRRGRSIVGLTWDDLDKLRGSAALATVLAAWPRTHALVLPTRGGKAFTPHGFGNMMASAIAAAGLPQACTADGLRRSHAIRCREVA